jgi:hypothetical protein
MPFGAGREQKAWEICRIVNKIINAKNGASELANIPIPMSPRPNKSIIKELIISNLFEVFLLSNKNLCCFFKSS